MKNFTRCAAEPEAKNAVCVRCLKQASPETDARSASRETRVALGHFHHCPACFQLLTLAEAEELRRVTILSRATVPAD